MKKIKSWLDPVQHYDLDDSTVRIGYYNSVTVDEETLKKLMENELFKLHLQQEHLTIE